jgi:hypothetical protein
VTACAAVAKALDDPAAAVTALLPELGPEQARSEGEFVHNAQMARSIGTATVGLPSLADPGFPLAETPGTVDRLAISLGAGIGHRRVPPRLVVAGEWSPSDGWLVGGRLRIPLPTPTPAPSVAAPGLGLTAAIDWINAPETDETTRTCLEAASLATASIAGGPRLPLADASDRATLSSSCPTQEPGLMSLGLRAGLNAPSSDPQTGDAPAAPGWHVGVAGSLGPADALVGLRALQLDQPIELSIAVRLRAPLGNHVYGVDPMARLAVETSILKPLDDSSLRLFTGVSLSLRLTSTLSLVTAGGWAMEGNTSGLRFNAALAFDADRYLLPYP